MLSFPEFILYFSSILSYFLSVNNKFRFQFLDSCLHYKFLIHFLPDGVSVYIQKATAIIASTIKINNPAFILYHFNRLFPILAKAYASMQPTNSITTSMVLILSP